MPIRCFIEYAMHREKRIYGIGNIFIVSCYVTTFCGIFQRLVWFYSTIGLEAKLSMLDGI